MRLFVEAELPDLCYVSEAAYWIALGRVPPDDREIVKDDNRNYVAVNFRVGDEAMWNGEVSSTDTHFREPEFRAFGVELDYLRYIEGIYRTGGVPGDEYLENHRRRNAETDAKYDFASMNPDFEAVRKQMWDEAVSNAREFDWARQFEVHFETIVDRARAMLFEALASGNISSKGWLAFTEEEMAANDGDGPAGGRGGRLVEIEANKWTLRHYDWDNETLTHQGVAFVGPLVSVESLLKKFPKPICDSREIKGEMTASSFIVADDTPVSAKVMARRGRPPKGDGLVRIALQNEFSRRKKDGRLSPKAEANIQGAMDWCSEILEHKVARSSVQRWLKGII